MKVLLSTCLLLALLSAVAALKCKACFGCGRKCREEDTKTVECAPDQDTCTTVSANYSLYYFPFGITYKGCSRSQECQEVYYSGGTVANQYGLLKSQCCQTDECNAQDLQVPDRSSLRPNGLQCPGFLSTSDSCYGPGTVQCVGAEDHCLAITFDMTPFGLPAKQIHFKGCVSQDLAILNPGPLDFGSGLLKFFVYDLSCSGGRGSCKLHQTTW